MICDYVTLCGRFCCNRSSASYDHKDSLGVSGAGGGGIAVPVVKSMSSSTWSSHDSPSASWTTQPHDADSYRYTAHQRLLLNHSATCNPAGITHSTVIDRLYELHVRGMIRSIDRRQIDLTGDPFTGQSASVLATGCLYHAMDTFPAREPRLNGSIYRIIFIYSCFIF